MFKNWKKYINYDVDNCTDMLHNKLRISSEITSVHVALILMFSCAL